MFTVAPCEGQKPIGILSDMQFEEMCNPTKYPTWRCGLVSERKTRLTVHEYFNQRLLDADGRFARDIEYFLTAQYAVESKQVADDASIAMRQTRGRLHRGQVLAAGRSYQEPTGCIRYDSKGLCLLYMQRKIIFRAIIFLYSACPNLEGIKDPLSYKFRRLTIGQNCAVCTNEVARA